MLQGNPVRVEYALRQLLRRAGVDQCNLPLTVLYGDYSTKGEGACLVIEPCADSDWKALLHRMPSTAPWIPACEAVPPGITLPFSDRVPVLFWGKRAEDGDKPFAELRPNRTVVFHADILAATFFMLSRWEETVVPTRDEHDRFPGTASVAYKQRFLDRPIVDEYAMILRAWLRVLLPRWEPKPRRFRVKLSHDIDWVRRLPNCYAAIRALGGDVVKRHSLRCAWKTLRGAIQPHQDPYFHGIGSLARLSQQYGLGDDAFYFMAADQGPLGPDYDVAAPLTKRCLENLRRQGFEIGLHAGYQTFNDPGRLAEEKARLEGVLGDTAYGGRQHFLRFQVPATWRHWEQVGLGYDSTMTYADHEGFRCGTCHPFRPFDVEQNRELALWEHPLMVMDGTLREYRGLTPQQGEARILELARRCRRVEGTFSLCWHNSSLDGPWWGWAQVYERVVRALA